MPSLLGFVSRVIMRTSRFVGVWWETWCGHWAARIHMAGPPKRMVRIGHFESEEQAAVAYDRVVLFVHGPRAPRNFPKRALTPASIQDIRRELRQRAKSHMTSRWEGVCLIQWANRSRTERPWSAELRLPSGRVVWLGHWATEKAAVQARDRAALFYLAEEARLNLPRIARRLGPADALALRAESERERKANASSRFRGVVWAKNAGCWRARITVAGEQRHLGLFSEEEDAARAYDAAARKAWGSAAKVNLPRSKTARPAPAHWPGLANGRPS
jgi:hypothetical protein